MKKLIIAVLLAIVSTVAKAENYNYLVIVSTDGTATSIAVDGLEITYSGGNMTATNSAETKTFALTSLDYMYFGEQTVNGIDSVKSFDYSQPVDVFSANGAYMGRFDDANAATLSLKKGVYIMKGQDKTTKFVVK